MSRKPTMPPPFDPDPVTAGGTARDRVGSGTGSSTGNSTGTGSGSTLADLATSSVDPTTATATDSPSASATPSDDPAPPTLRARLGKVLAWVNGPYRAAGFAVVLVVAVLFGRDVLSTLRVRADIRRLHDRKEELLQSIAADSALLRSLDDAEQLERFARERYLMRRDGETLYIIED